MKKIVKSAVTAKSVVHFCPYSPFVVVFDWVQKTTRLKHPLSILLIYFA